MSKISKGLVGRTVRTALFTILIIVLCTVIPSAGIYLVSEYGPTQSREQVPLTALCLGDEGEMGLPGRGRMAEGNGRRLRSFRDSYTLTLDNVITENMVMESAESSRPVIDITGGLTIELKESNGSRIQSEGAGIRIRSGTLVIRGKGNLDTGAKAAGILGDRTENGQVTLHPEGGQPGIKGTYAGVSYPEVDIAGGIGTVSALGRYGTGIYSCRVKVEEPEGGMMAESSGAAVLAGSSGEMRPSMRSNGKVTAEPDDVRVVESDAARLEHTAGHKEGIRGWMGGTHPALFTYSTEGMVTYSESTSCFGGSARTLRFVTG